MQKLGHNTRGETPKRLFAFLRKILGQVLFRIIVSDISKNYGISFS